MKKCPRCHKMTMADEEPLNSLSKRDNKTYICHSCGIEEDCIDHGMNPPNKNECDFVAKVAKQTK